MIIIGTTKMPSEHKYYAYWILYF